MTKKREWITAEELTAKLEADPDWVADRDRREEERREHWAAVDAALVPVVEELRAAGCAISNLFDLENSPYPKTFPWPAAISILSAHLQKTTYPRDARVKIANGLAVSEMRTPWDVLLKLYRDEREQWVKEKLANGIIRSFDKEKFDDVLALVRDKSNGTSRVLLLYILEKTKDPRGRATMEELADDPDLAIQIPISLKVLDRRKLKQAERQALKNPTRH